jgi:hypothetical protein
MWRLIISEDRKSVTYVSEHVLPISPVYTVLRTWANTLPATVLAVLLLCLFRRICEADFAADFDVTLFRDARCESALAATLFDCLLADGLLKVFEAALAALPLVTFPLLILFPEPREIDVSLN